MYLFDTSLAIPLYIIACTNTQDSVINSEILVPSHVFKNSKFFNNRFFKEGPPIPGNRRDEEHREDFDRIFNESFSDMEKHMEMMQRKMENIFQRFGVMHIPCKSVFLCTFCLVFIYFVFLDIEYI
jgi:hypothetical protein